MRNSYDDGRPQLTRSYENTSEISPEIGRNEMIYAHICICDDTEKGEGYFGQNACRGFQTYCRKEEQRSDTSSISF